MESVTFVQQAKHGIMDDDDDHHHEEEKDDVGSLSSFSEEEEDDDEGSSNSVASSSSDFMEDASSSGSSSNGPLFEMSSLISQLPFKRGLSKHFEGKSQSFTSLSNVKRLEDLIKPERPLKKRLKSSKSYCWGLDKSLSPKGSSGSSQRRDIAFWGPGLLFLHRDQGASLAEPFWRPLGSRETNQTFIWLILRVGCNYY